MKYIYWAEVWFPSWRRKTNREENGSRADGFSIVKYKYKEFYLHGFVKETRQE